MLDESVDGLVVAGIEDVVIVLTELHPLLCDVVSLDIGGWDLESVALDSHVISIFDYHLCDELVVSVPNPEQGVLFAGTLEIELVALGDHDTLCDVSVVACIGDGDELVGCVVDLSLDGEVAVGAAGCGKSQCDESK